MENVIQDIQDRLVAEVPALKYVDQDWGQMDFWQEHPVKYPCALIDIQSGDYSDVGQLVQQGYITVVVSLFDMKLSNSSHAAPQAQKDKAKRIWTLVKDVNKALHGQQFLEAGYGLPMRSQMRRMKREDGCFQTNLIYTIQLTDASCKKVLPVATNVKPVISISRLRP